MSQFFIPAAKLQKNAELYKHFCKKIAYPVKQNVILWYLARHFTSKNPPAGWQADGKGLKEYVYFLLRAFLPFGCALVKRRERTREYPIVFFLLVLIQKFIKY